jgi:magnesium transporter
MRTSLSNSLNKIAHTLSYDTRNRSKLFLELEVRQRAVVLMKLSKYVRQQLLKKITDEDIIDTIDHLDPNDATDVLQLLPKKRQKIILARLREHLKQSVATLLNFDPETAAGMMSLEYIQVESDKIVSEVISEFRKHEKRTGKVATILVTDNGVLKGQLPGYTLALAEPEDSVGKYVRKILSIPYTAKSKEVANYFRNNPHSKVAVLGDEGQVLGIIFTDDIISLINSYSAASLYDFAGVSNEESIFDDTARKVKFRYKWLMVNLFTAFLAAFTVSLFDETISKYVLLAVYMPIVAGMGGNAATQTLAVMVRGLSQNMIDLRTTLRILKNEVSSGLVNGVINGIIVMVIVYMLNNDVLLAMVLGSAMVINLLIAGTFGTLVPIIMKKLGKDPASSATIFITTATDVFGFMAFLGLATLVLR